MTELLHDGAAGSGDSPATRAIDERDGNARSSLTGFNTLPIAESDTIQANPESLAWTTDSTAAPSLADSVNPVKQGLSLEPMSNAPPGRRYYRLQNLTARLMHSSAKSSKWFPAGPVSRKASAL